MPSREANGSPQVEQEPPEITHIEIPPQDGYSQSEDGYLVTALQELGLLSGEYLYAPFSEAQLRQFVETGSPQEFFEEELDCYQYNNEAALVDVISSRTSNGIIEYLSAGVNYTGYIAIYDRKYLQHSHDRSYKFVDPNTGTSAADLVLIKRAAFLGVIKVTLLDH